MVRKRLSWLDRIVNNYFFDRLLDFEVLLLWLFREAVLPFLALFLLFPPPPPLPCFPLPELLSPFVLMPRLLEAISPTIPPPPPPLQHGHNSFNMVNVDIAICQTTRDDVWVFGIEFLAWRWIYGPRPLGLQHKAKSSICVEPLFHFFYNQTVARKIVLAKGKSAMIVTDRPRLLLSVLAMFYVVLLNLQD